MRRRIIIFFSIVLVAASGSRPAQSEELNDTIDTKAIATLAIASTAVNYCDLKFDNAVVKKFLTEKIKVNTISPSALADSIATTAGMTVVDHMFWGKSPAVSCKVIAQRFGVGGSEVPGLLTGSGSDRSK